MKGLHKLVMTETTHGQLRRHLFQGDGLESAAILICSHAGNENQRLCVRKVIEVPTIDCKVRKRNSLTWPGAWIEKAIDEAEDASNSIILLHSHPGGYYGFSEVDDDSDQLAVNALNQAICVEGVEHGSAIMTPDGAIMARLYDANMNAPRLLMPIVIGHDVRCLTPDSMEYVLPFSDGMTDRLHAQTACLVGVSGTGSIVAELLFRLGFGHVVMIEYDWVEDKNLNRILNSTTVDAELKSPKTNVAERAAQSHRTDVIISNCSEAISSKRAVELASSADVIFSCIDSVEGRHYCDLISQACLIPLIDIGVTIPTRAVEADQLRIGDVCGRIDYVIPGGASLLDREVVTPEALSREYLRKANPDALSELVAEGYIKGDHSEAPSVISLNMRAASAGVNEWLARNFEIREEPNHCYARTLFSLAACEEDYVSEQQFSNSPKPYLAVGLSGLVKHAGVSV